MLISCSLLDVFEFARLSMTYNIFECLIAFIIHIFNVIVVPLAGPFSFLELTLRQKKRILDQKRKTPAQLACAERQ